LCLSVVADFILINNNYTNAQVLRKSSVSIRSANH